MLMGYMRAVVEEVSKMHTVAYRYQYCPISRFLTYIEELTIVEPWTASDVSWVLSFCGR